MRLFSGKAGALLPGLSPGSDPLKALGAYGTTCQCIFSKDMIVSSTRSSSFSRRFFPFSVFNIAEFVSTPQVISWVDRIRMTDLWNTFDDCVLSTNLFDDIDIRNLMLLSRNFIIVIVSVEIVSIRVSTFDDSLVMRLFLILCSSEVMLIVVISWMFFILICAF
jgi:hypothetical protein